QLGITVKKVSEATQKGRHTTVHPELILLNGGGWVADTPGVRALALYDIDKYELDGYFRDICLYVDHCAFNNCTHSQESGCAVRAAVERGEIQSRRYESYLRIRAG
ncbi:MAG: GTPase RsgA, partial [Chloroflexi bacterium]|nr:GTPase RsgA [Chloroflexota bacterium]